MFKSKYIPTVLFEGMRLKSVDGANTVAQRYVTAQGFIHAKTGVRKVEYYNPLGRRCSYEDAPAATQEASNKWMMGMSLPDILHFGSVGDKSSLSRPLEPFPVAPAVESSGEAIMDGDVPI